MRTQLIFLWIASLLAAALRPVAAAQAQPAQAYLAGNATAAELIAAMNMLRVSYGYSPLLEDPIVDAVAQVTAETMAASQMSWHIGNVRGRLAAAGYGGGATVWATENFAVGKFSIDELMVGWSDADHLRPAADPAYCHVGAGVAKAANGMTYYVLQAAYIAGQACGESTLPPGFTPQAGSGAISQRIVPVKVSTPDADGNIYHIVQAGQSFWAIAVAYQVTIRDLEFWNNLSQNTPLQVGQRLLIPGKNTKGYATPTPVGMIVPSTPDVGGKIVHVVQPYQSLILIADAYDSSVETILRLNGWQEEWPLQVGQKLIVFGGYITPSSTPRPLTPIEKLTPASDGRYYHTVQSGETLSWIASLYEVSLADLMSWNHLTQSSVIYPGDNLLLQVTPPVTPTFTPGPPSDTPAATLTPEPPATTQAPPTALPSSATPEPAPGSPDGGWGLPIAMLLTGIAVGVLLFKIFSRRPAPPPEP